MGKTAKGKKGKIVYQETFGNGPGKWVTGKAFKIGSWHRNIFGDRGGPVPLGWKRSGGPHGGYAYAESPWYFDDNHGQFMWLYLAFFMNRSADIGLAGQDLRDARIQALLRGSRLDLKGTKLFFWIQGLARRKSKGGADVMYNWALTSQPIEAELVDGQWHKVVLHLRRNEKKWSHMGLLNGGLARKIQINLSVPSGKGSLDSILGGRHVNFGFLLCGVDSCDPPTGRIDVGEVTLTVPR